MDNVPGMPSPNDPSPGEGPGPGARTNPIGAWVVGVVLVLLIVVGALWLVVASRSGSYECDDWHRTKAEWVAGFTPVEQKTKADLADYQGWIEMDGVRYERPEGC